jgi:hypothetical protein
VANSVHTDTMKKLINSPQDVVREELEGMEAAHGDRLRINYNPVYIVRRKPPAKGKVALISGGGSGHDPMHGGMWESACSTQHAPATSSPAPRQTRFSKRARPRTAAAAFCRCGHVTLVCAMHLAKAVIATDSQGIADYIKSGDNGILCKASSPVDLAGRCRQALERSRNDRAARCLK